MPATKDAILDAAEEIVVSAQSLDEVSVRRIVAKARANVSAISYHFGSREKLIVAVVERVYKRFNAERLRLLQEAVDARAPEPAELERVIAALIGPSIRWSLDPASDYPAFLHIATLVQNTRDPKLRGNFAGKVEHLRAFIPPLRRVAPWFSDAEIAWRIHCALGVRHNVVRDRLRAEVLLEGAYDLGDPEEVLRRTIEVIVPMFGRKQRIANSE
jgi:AcrR family transcriptional regulator